jgi:predicted ribosome quality control (RQC) complex YloA/Tae2 family protein
VGRAAALYAERQRGGGGGGGDGGASSNSSSTSVAGAAAAAAAAAQPTLLGGIVRAYQGVGPALAEELCATAGVAPTAAPASLSDSEWHKLHAAWLAWLAALSEGRFAPSLSADGARFSLLGAFGDNGGDSASGSGSSSSNSNSNSNSSSGRRFESAHEMLEAYFAPLQAAEQHASLHASLTASTRAALKKARGRAFAFKKQLAAAEGEPQVRREADIIMANVYQIAPGAAALETEDWDTGERVTLQLDPLKGAVEQAEALYKRARKLKRAAGAVAPLLEAAEAEVEYLEQARCCFVCDVFVLCFFIEDGLCAAPIPNPLSNTFTHF